VVEGLIGRHRGAPVNGPPAEMIGPVGGIRRRARRYIARSGDLQSNGKVT